jgi:hypothetical protein
MLKRGEGLKDGKKGFLSRKTKFKEGQSEWKGLKVRTND